MRNWFKKQGDTPRLLSLSPLRTDSRIDLISNNDGKLQNTAVSTHRSRIDTGPRIWPPTINSSRNDTHLYNVEESVIVVERKSDRKRTKSQPRYTKCDNSRLREKRNPLLDRVKHTRLSCFKSPPINLNTTEEPAVAPDIPTVQVDKIEKQAQSTSLDNLLSNIPKSTPSSCFSDKLKAISEKYLQPSTNRFFAKLYKNPQQGNSSVSVQSSPAAEARHVSAKLRSFSYGALPGLEDFHKTGSRNPLYREEDVGLLQDDNYADELDDLDNRLHQQRSAKEEYGEDDSDSGILVSGESTCSSSSFRLRSGEDQIHLHHFDRRRNAKRAQSLDRREITKKIPNTLTPISVHIESEEKSFLSVHFDKTVEDEDLGIVVTRKEQEGGKLGEYAVTELVPGCLAHTLGTVMVGDEIVHVNGRRVTEEDVNYNLQGTTRGALRTRSLHVHIMLLRCSRPLQQDKGIEIGVTVQTKVDFDHHIRTPVIIAYGTPPASHKHFQKNYSTYNSRKMSSRRGGNKKGEPGSSRDLEESTDQSGDNDTALDISFVAEEVAAAARSLAFSVQSPVSRPQKIIHRRLAVYPTEEEDDDDDDDDGYAKVRFQKKDEFDDTEEGDYNYETIKFENKDEQLQKLDDVDAVYATIPVNKDAEQPEETDGSPAKTSPKKRAYEPSNPIDIPKPFTRFLVPPPPPHKCIFTSANAAAFTRSTSSTSVKPSSSIVPISKRVIFPTLGNEFAQSLYDDPMPSTSTGITFFDNPSTSIQMERSPPPRRPYTPTVDFAEPAALSQPIGADDEDDATTSISSLSPITESSVASLSEEDECVPAMIDSPLGSDSEPAPASQCVSEEASGMSSTNFCTLPRRPQGPVCTYFTIELEKGGGRKSLGFGIVGGSDSPKGALGIYISSLIPGLQAFEDGRLKEGDEILAINGTSLHNFGHDQALQFFKDIKTGPVVLQISRRANTINKINNTKAKSCTDLAQPKQDDD